jgi:hypothetical protein
MPGKRITNKECTIRIHVNGKDEVYSCRCTGGTGFNTAKLGEILFPGHMFSGSMRADGTEQLSIQGIPLDSSVLTRLKNGRIFPRYCSTAARNGYGD